MATNFWELPYQARKFYNGNGSTKDFLVTFPGGKPLDRAHVQVYLNQSLYSSGWSIVTVGGQDYVRFTDAPSYGTGNVMLKRVTPSTEDTRVVDFTGGSLLTSADLDKSQLNCLYVSQESSDLFLDQGGAAVNLDFSQTIPGSKTFSGTTTISGPLKFTNGTPIGNLVGGQQWVMAADGPNGDVRWEQTTLTNIPGNIVLTDGPTTFQSITSPKQFDAPVAFNVTPTFGVNAVANRALVSNDSSGTAVWKPVVNGIRLGSASAAVSTGEITITAASLGVLSTSPTGSGAQQVTGPVNFTDSVGLGDSSSDNLVINSSLKITPNAGLGKILTSDANGNCAWATPAPTGIQSINGQTGTNGAITITAASLGAVSVDGAAQIISGQKTFTNHVTLGQTSLQNITVLGQLVYPVGTLSEGKVLTSTATGACVWQTPEPAGVITVNGASGAVTLTASDLGALTAATIPTASASVKGGVKVGSGLAIATDGTLSVPNSAGLPIASSTTLGGIKIGSNLSINQDGVLSAGISQTTGVTKFNNRTGDVVPASGDYTAAQVTNAVDTNSTQKITAQKSVTGSTSDVGTSGAYGVLLDPLGIVKSQRDSSTASVFEGRSPSGGITTKITAGGDIVASGVIEAQGGFKTTAGMTIGDNIIDGIILNGTLKIPPNAAVDRVLTCTTSDGRAEWTSITAPPVTSVNGRTGAIVVTADDVTTGIGAVTKDSAQTITGVKTFAGNASFLGDVTLGDATTDTVNIGATMRVAFNKGVDKVLTCVDAETGAVGWENPKVQSVNGQIGVVTLTAAGLGAATTAQLATTNANVTAAQTTANNAATTAANAQATADSKIALVTIGSTIAANGSTALTCLSGNGTTANPLKVVGAPPIDAAGGDLSGSYPNPTIGLNKVTYNKIQKVSPLKLLGGPTTGTAVDDVREISLGSGLKYEAGALTTVNNGDVTLTGAQTISGAKTFSGTSTFSGNVSVSAASTIIGDAAADTLTVNATPTFLTDVTVSSKKLVISGTGTGPGFQMAVGAQNGYVLTSDASGNGTWKSSTSSNAVPTDIGTSWATIPVGSIFMSSASPTVFNGTTAPTLLSTHGREKFTITTPVGGSGPVMTWTSNVSNGAVLPSGAQFRLIGLTRTDYVTSTAPLTALWQRIS